MKDLYRIILIGFVALFSSYAIQAQCDDPLLITTGSEETCFGSDMTSDPNFSTSFSMSYTLLTNAPSGTLFEFVLSDVNNPNFSDTIVVDATQAVNLILESGDYSYVLSSITPDDCGQYFTTSGTFSNYCPVSYPGNLDERPIDLYLTKTVDIDSAAIADNVTFTIMVYNDGPEGTTNLNILESLPPNTVYSGNYTASQGTFADSIWNVGSLAVNDSAMLTITVASNGEGIHTNVAEVFSADGIDTDSTPNNGDVLEDDQASACFTTPYLLCEGENGSFLLEAPTGFTTYQWYKDGTPIAGATTSSYSVTEAGAYLLTVEDAILGDCGNQLCCPILVEVGNCCPATQCIKLDVTKL